MKKEINIAIIGTQFMGRAHTNAWIDVSGFYDLPFTPVLKAACDIDPSLEESFARRYGWESFDTSWEKVVSRDDIDVVDICTSNASHMPIALAAASAGKHVICEKPLAMNADQARQMVEAAEQAGVAHMTAFNYRTVPAVQHAKRLIGEGKLGSIYHFNAVYLQDFFADPGFMWLWRCDKEIAGSGAHGDMNAHIVDLARYLVGEFESVSGAMETFTRQRPKPDGSMGRVTVDDATYFMARFHSGALGSFIATRCASGRKNHMRIEIYGSRGSLVFNLERLNELQYFSASDTPGNQGFRNILVTEKVHPYIRKWWPPGHIIGWEHTFIHEIGDFLTAVAGNQKASPGFEDGYRCQQVLDAVMQSAREDQWQQIPAN